MTPIGTKVSKNLNIILLFFLFIGFRVWHLSVIQYDTKVEESRKPQRKTLREPAKRGTIRDRFNIPLATNKIHYRVGILYSQFSQVPKVAWEKDASGKSIKRLKRRDYIQKFSKILGQILAMDSEYIEDLIYSKASLHGNVPYVLRDGLSEQVYHRLKMMEKDWLGLHVQKVPVRYYPQGKLGCDVLGYMGAINKREYEQIIHEINELKEWIELWETGEEVIFPEKFSNIWSVKNRLRDLEEKAYSIQDYIGKSGIEGQYEEILRGFHGKKSFYSDARGNFLRELPGGREPIPGQRILLTISSELQGFCEKLLIQHEQNRDVRISGKTFHPGVQKDPWIKGGAIVVMDPKDGGILALASYPRFDPNDFIFVGNLEENRIKKRNIHRWFETEQHISQIWNLQRPLEREVYDMDMGKNFEEKRMLDWETYLSFILPPNHPIRHSFKQIGTLKRVVSIQHQMKRLFEIFENDNPYLLLQFLYPQEEHVIFGPLLSESLKEDFRERYVEHQEEIKKIKQVLSPIFSRLPLHYDKVLCLDLCQIAVDDEKFDREMIAKLGEQTINHHRDLEGSFLEIEELVKKMAKNLFHCTTFKQWRETNQKDFLKEKRQHEKEAKLYAKPYLDYLELEESLQFSEFWEQKQWALLIAFLTGHLHPDVEVDPYFLHFLTWHEELKQGAHFAISWLSSYIKLQKVVEELSPSIGMRYLQSFRRYEDLSRPLYGRYRYLKKGKSRQLEKHLAGAFYSSRGYGYGRSHAFRQAAVQGSIFKLIPAFESMSQFYQTKGDTIRDPLDLNPMTMVDLVRWQDKKLFLGFGPNGESLYQRYQGGRLPRSVIKTIGKVDLLRAFEYSSNPYFAILASEYIHSPSDLLRAASEFSYGSKTGLDLPGEFSGKLPDDVDTNKTGLYAFAIGQHTLIVTPLQSAVMLCTIANGGDVYKPHMTHMIAGKVPKREDQNFEINDALTCQRSVNQLGMDLSLSEMGQNSEVVRRVDSEIVRHVEMPNPIQRMLLEMMRRVFRKIHFNNANPNYQKFPEAIQDFNDVKDSLIGKTSTSESVENLDLDLELGTNTYNHIWFGGIAFEQDGNDEQKNFLYCNQIGTPELVVIVYLRFGSFGKDASPIAAQVVKKWREISRKK